MGSLPDYSEEYIEAVFGAWYRAGAPGLMSKDNRISVGGREIIRVIPAAPDGNKPTIHTVMNWMNKYAWRERADALDAQVAKTFERELVQERVITLRKLAEAGHTLLDKGLEWISKNENPFGDNAAAGVRAIVSATEMIYKYEGAADKLTAIQQMSDKQLEREIRALLGTEPNENDDTVDATLEDVPDAEDDNA